MTPLDVLKREMETMLGTVKRESQISDDWHEKARQMDERLERHLETIGALRVAIDTLEAK